jgi:hypothetical protein
MSKANKIARKGADHYERSLKIHGSFADVIKVSMTNPDKLKEKSVKNKGL